LKKYSFTEWIAVFSKDWLIPTVGKVAGIATVSSAFFSLSSDTALPPALEKNIAGFFDLTNSRYYRYVLFTVIALLLITWIAKEFSTGYSGFWDKVAKKRGMVSLVSNFLFGAILLPLVVGIVALAGQGKSISGLLPLAVSFVFISALIHWLGVDDLRPDAGITYCVRPGAHGPGNEFRRITAVRLDELMAYCEGARSVAVFSEAKDGCLTLFVPIEGEVAQFSPEILDRWVKFTGAIESEWNAAGIKFVRVCPPALLLASQ
jgi:hypothetical protein